MNIFKSKTINFSILLAGMCVVADNMETLQPYFGEYGPMSGVVVASFIAMLRVVTTKPLKEK